MHSPWHELLGRPLATIPVAAILGEGVTTLEESGFFGLQAALESRLGELIVDNVEIATGFDHLVAFWNATEV